MFNLHLSTRSNTSPVVFITLKWTWFTLAWYIFADVDFFRTNTFTDDDFPDAKPIVRKVDFYLQKRETKSGNAFFTQWTLETIIFSHSQSKRMWFSVHNGTHTSYDHIWDDSLKTARYTIRLFWSSSRSRRRFFFLKWKIITFISATCFEWNEMKIIRKESSNDIFFFTHLHFNHKCSDQFFFIFELNSKWKENIKNDWPEIFTFLQSTFRFSSLILRTLFVSKMKSVYSISSKCTYKQINNPSQITHSIDNYTFAQTTTHQKHSNNFSIITKINSQLNNE